ncbi:hypothetical protein V1517DRAFT_313663 [Lipomyces orientalis]|uniref:Uncharacterized protein n=1 Tax=Lipomyces orientalis TaxID=1233043 RepID=A0ACC3TX94_9ASCO
MDLPAKSDGTDFGRQPSTLRRFFTRTFSRRKTSKKKLDASVFSPQEHTEHTVNPTISAPETDLPVLRAQTLENQERQSPQLAVEDSTSKSADQSIEEISDGLRTPPWSYVPIPADSVATILAGSETAEFGCLRPKKIGGTPQSLRASKLSSENMSCRVVSPLLRSRNDALKPLSRGTDTKLVRAGYGTNQERGTQVMMMTTQHGDWDEFMDCYARGQYSLCKPPPPPRGRPNFKYFVPPMPPNEGKRLVEVAQYDVAYSSEFAEACRDLIATARKSFGLRGVSVSLIAKNAQIVKAEIGLNTNMIDRKVSLEGNTILSLEPIVICDTLLDWRFAKNPLVTNFPSIGFWASAPIISPAGHAIGAFSIWDAYPREDLTFVQRRQLQGFADAAMNEMERASSRLLPSTAAQCTANVLEDDRVSMYSAEGFDLPDAPRSKRSGKREVVERAPATGINIIPPYRGRRVAYINKRRSVRKKQVLATPTNLVQDSVTGFHDQNENAEGRADTDGFSSVSEDPQFNTLGHEEVNVNFRTPESQEERYSAGEDVPNWLSDYFDSHGQVRYSSAVHNRAQRLRDKEKFLFAGSSSTENISRLPCSPALPLNRRSPFREVTNTNTVLAILAKVAAISLGLDVAYFIEVGKSTASEEHEAELDRLLYGDILGSPVPEKEDPVDGIRLSKRLLAAYGIMRDDPEFDSKLHYRALNSQFGLAYHNSTEKSSSYYGILIPFRRYFHNIRSLRSYSGDKLSTELSSGRMSSASSTSDRISTSKNPVQSCPPTSQFASCGSSNRRDLSMIEDSGNATLIAINQELSMATEGIENLSTLAKNQSYAATVPLQSRSQTPNVISVSLPTDTSLPTDVAVPTSGPPSQDPRQPESNGEVTGEPDAKALDVTTTSPMIASPRAVRLRLPVQPESGEGPASADSASTAYSNQTSQSTTDRSTPATSINVSPSEVAKPVPVAVLPTPNRGLEQDDIPSLLRAKSIDSRMNMSNQASAIAKKRIKLTIDTTGNKQVTGSQAVHKTSMAMVDIHCQPSVSRSYTSAVATTGSSSHLTSGEDENTDSDADADAVIAKFPCDGGVVFGGFSAAKKEYSQSDMEFIDKFKALVNEGIEWIR